MTMPDRAPSNSPISLWKTLLPVAVILAFVISGLLLLRNHFQSAHAPSAAQNTPIEVGNTLRDFSLKQFGGGETSLSRLPSKVLMVNFWATWCEACMLEMPSIVRLQKNYSTKGFDVVSINVDENPETVLPATLKKYHIDFPVYLDTEQKISEIFDVSAIPLTVVLDHNLKILLVEKGERNWNGNDFHEDLDRWLKGAS